MLSFVANSFAAKVLVIVKSSEDHFVLFFVLLWYPLQRQEEGGLSRM